MGSYDEMADFGASFLCLFLGNGRTIYTRRKKNLRKNKPVCYISSLLDSFMIYVVNIIT